MALWWSLAVYQGSDWISSISLLTTYFVPATGLSTYMHPHPPFFYEVVRLLFHFA